MNHLGDFAEDAIVDFKWSSNSAAGASITRATDGTISVYIGNGTTQLTTGVTDTEDFDSVTGVHHCRIDLSASASYAVGSECQVVLSGSTIDGQTVNAVLASFSIERAGGVLAVLKGLLEASSDGNIFKAVTLQNVDAPVREAVGLASANLDTQLAALQSDTNDIQARLPAALVSGRIDASVGAMAANVLTATAINADAFTAAKFAADVTTEFQSGLATAAALATVDTVVDAIQVTTDKLDDMLVNSSDGWIYTAAALQDAPAAGGSGPTAAEIADAVWEEAIADHSGTAGSTAEALNAAGSAGDPWVTALPGAYGSGSAGFILGTNLNATVSSRASQASVDTIDGIVDSILVDTAEIGSAGAGLTALASAAALATVDGVVDAILVDTAEIGAAGAGLTAVPWNAAWDAEVQSEVADALGVYDGPTNAEMVARTLATADYATAAALATVDTVVDSILADTGTDGVVVAAASKSDYRLSATGVDDILDEVVEGSVTLRQSVRLANSALGGKASGLATTEATFRDLADTKDRLVATVDADGNRSAVTRDLT